MHRTWNLLVLLGFSATLTASSPPDSPLLVTVELSKPSACAFFDRLRPRVYYAAESWALLELLPAQVDLARRAGQVVTVIDNRPDPGSYRLLAKKRARVESADVSGAVVLLERDGVVITRGTPSIDAARSRGGLTSVRLRPRPLELDPGTFVGTKKLVVTK